MKKYLYSILVISFISLFLAFNFFCQGNSYETRMQTSSSDIIELPAPNHSGKISVEEALLKRRSIRDYTDNPLSLSDISQILWAAQGITGERYDFRTAPSAGGLYPLEIYVASSNVKDLGNSLYKYRPKNNTLVKISDGDKRQDMSNAALGQDAIDNSSAIILITAVYERTSVKYGSRAERYAHIEVGAVVQNIYIQSVSIGLGTVMIGAFKDDHLKNVLNLPADEQPLAIMPLGKI